MRNLEIMAKVLDLVDIIEVMNTQSRRV